MVPKGRVRGQDLSKCNHAARMGRAWTQGADIFNNNEYYNKVDLVLGSKNDGKRQIAQGDQVPFNKGFPGE